MISVRAGVLAATLVLAATFLDGAAASGASAAARPRAIVESASAGWMIVHDTRSAKPIGRGASGGALEATTLAQAACVLSPRVQPPWNPGAPIAVAGDSYVQPAAANGGYSMRVHAQQGCDRFTDATPGLPQEEVLLTPAPGGYVTVVADERGAAHLNWYRTSSGVTSFAPPVSGSTTTWAAVAGDAGLIAFSLPSKTTSTASRIQFMPWSKPGAWTTLLVAAPRTALACTPPSATHVVCVVGSRGPGLLALDGHARTWLRASHPRSCTKLDLATASSTLVALETSNAGACTAGRLLQLDASGRLSNGSARRLYSVPAGIHGGLGGILVSTPDQHLVLRLKTVTDRGTIAWPAQGY